LADLVLRFFPHQRRRFTPGAIRFLRMRRRVDCTKARQELGYQPTSIVQAVREAYDFFVQRGLISVECVSAGANLATHKLTIK
jgi:nucleoside-diphosphate-sugar epimerase